MDVLQVSYRVQYPEDYQDLSYEDHKEFKQTKYGNGFVEWCCCDAVVLLFLFYVSLLYTRLTLLQGADRMLCYVDCICVLCARLLSDRYSASGIQCLYCRNIPRVVLGFYAEPAVAKSVGL